MSDYNENVKKWVRRYLDDKFAPTPLVPATNSEPGTNGKAARLPDWSKQKVTDAGVFGNNDGCGLNCGPMGYAKPKEALICVDSDSEEAVLYADRFLPATGMIAGREKKPRSNRFYIVHEKGTPSGAKFIAADKDTHVEILGEGHQTVVPPTIVIGRDGNPQEKIWYEYGDSIGSVGGGPAQVDWEELLGCVTRLAVFCEVVRIWPKRGRHRISLPLAGGLLRAGWDPEDVVWAIHTLATRTGWDTTPNEIENLVYGTVDKLERGEEKVTGWPRLIQELGDTEEVKASIKKIINWLGTDSDERPAIELRAGQLDRIVAKAWQILKDANDPVHIMRFSNEPVRIERMDDRDQWGIVPLNIDRLRYHVTQHIAWYKSGKDGDRKPQDPPVDVIRLMLAAGDVPLPILNRIVTAPVFSPQGIIQTEPGYHPEAKTFYAPATGLSIPEVTEKPTNEEVDRARKLILDDMLVDFPFSKKSDLAHTFALLFLPFTRDLISGPTPMHIIDASIQAAGKTLLGAIVTMPFTGGDGALATGFPTSEEEMAKTLLSLLAEGRTHINFDNVVGRMSSSHLALAITSYVYNQRRLGVSETLAPPVRCVWMATANQASGDTDVIRRSIHIRLVPTVEHPHLIPIDRWKHFPLRTWVREHRGEIIWACLTLIQKWISEGAVKRNVSFGDFGDWAGVMGGILESVGINGFLDDITDFQLTANESLEAWRTFYADLWHRFGRDPWPAADVYPIAIGAGLEISGRDTEQQKRELGAMLRGKLEVIHGGLRLQTTDKPVRRGSGKGYYLEPVDGREEWKPNLNPPIEMEDQPGIIKLRGIQ